VVCQPGSKGGLATNFDDGSDHAEPTLVKIERIGAETGRLSPSKSGTVSGRNDGAVPIGHSREQAGYSSSRVMIRSSVLCLRREGNRMSSQELNASRRLRTADRRTALVSW
jgi:hypothetical protein